MGGHRKSPSGLAEVKYPSLPEAGAIPNGILRYYPAYALSHNHPKLLGMKPDGEGSGPDTASPKDKGEITNYMQINTHGISLSRLPNLS